MKTEYLVSIDVRSKWVRRMLTPAPRRVGGGRSAVAGESTYSTCDDKGRPMATPISQCDASCCAGAWAGRNPRTADRCGAAPAFADAWPWAPR